MSTNRILGLYSSKRRINLIFSPFSSYGVQISSKLYIDKFSSSIPKIMVLYFNVLPDFLIKDNPNNIFGRLNYHNDHFGTAF